MPTVTDREELTTIMEPLRLSESSRHRAALSDVALELAMQSARFRSSLPEAIHVALGDLVRSMNCYWRRCQADGFRSLKPDPSSSN